MKIMDILPTVFPNVFTTKHPKNIVHKKGKSVYGIGTGPDSKELYTTDGTDATDGTSSDAAGADAGDGGGE